MGHAKEIITIDVYGDTAETPKEESESGIDFSENNYILESKKFICLRSQ